MSMGRISSLKELMNDISWSWQYPDYDFIKTGEGYVLNKLYISPTMVEYKTDRFELAPGVFEQFEKLVGFLNGEGSNS